MSMNLVVLLYLVASVCFIQALKGLSHPTTSIRGNLFGMTGFSAGAKMESMQKIIAELRDNAKLSIIGQGAIQAAQAARIVQRTLEGAGSADPVAIHKALAAVKFPSGDPDLYVAKPQGLAFAEDRLPADGSAMFIQWLENQGQEVVFPSEFAQVKPRART